MDPAIRRQYKDRLAYLHERRRVVQIEVDTRQASLDLLLDEIKVLEDEYHGLKRDA